MWGEGPIGSVHRERDMYDPLLALTLAAGFALHVTLLATWRPEALSRGLAALRRGVK